jgi:antirestriction protein ArdC
MKRKQLTKDQKAATAARRQAFRQLAAKIAAMTEEQRRKIVARIGAVVTCEGHALSVYNTCLLIYQRADVSIVGGYQQWKRADRHVKKGESGMQIWIPIKGKEEEVPSVEQLESDKEEKPAFIMGTVFDISQTEPQGSVGEREPEGSL